MSQKANVPGDRGQIFDGSAIGCRPPVPCWTPATGHCPICPRISLS